MTSGKKGVRDARAASRSARRTAPWNLGWGAICAPACVAGRPDLTHGPPREERLSRLHAANPSGRRPAAARRRRDRHQSLRHGPDLRRQPGALERGPSRPDPGPASGFRRRRLRHHSDQQLRRQSPPPDAAWPRGPRARAQPPRRPKRPQGRRQRRATRRRRRIGRTDRRPHRSARTVERRRGGRRLRRADRGPARRRRGRRLDRNHVRGRGNPRGGAWRRRNAACRTRSPPASTPPAAR